MWFCSINNQHILLRYRQRFLRAQENSWKCSQRVKLPLTLIAPHSFSTAFAEAKSLRNLNIPLCLDELSGLSQANIAECCRFLLSKCRNCIKCAWIPTCLHIKQTRTQPKAHRKSTMRFSFLYPLNTKNEWKEFSPDCLCWTVFPFFRLRISSKLISSALMPPQWEPYKMLSRHEWCTNMQLCIPRRSCTTISFLRSVKLYTTRTCVVLKISCSGWCFFFSSYSRALPVDSLRRTHADYTWLLHDFVVKISFCECASDEKQFLAAPEIDDGREWIKYYWNIHRATRVPLPMLIKYLRSHKQNIFQSRLFFLCMLANGENAYHRIGLAA